MCGSHSQPIVVKVKRELPACVSTSVAGSQDQPEAQWADLQDWSSPPLPTSPPRQGERRAHGCAGVTQTQLDGHNTKFKEDRTPCSTGRTRLITLVLSFGFYLPGRFSVLKCCRLKLGLVVLFAEIHVSPFGTRRICHLSYRHCLPGAAEVMPARFQQLGGEVIFFPWQLFTSLKKKKKECLRLFVFLPVKWCDELWAVGKAVIFCLNPCAFHCSVRISIWRDFTHGFISVAHKKNGKKRKEKQIARFTSPNCTFPRTIQ